MKMSNPDRSSRGGDVPGSTKIDMTGAVGSAIDVSESSFDPGYDIELGYTNGADLKRGFCNYGIGVGEKRGPGYL
jgi:hypothetical protein